jgi:peptidyl-prolyl cis-trans isomerase A (cyclophilin A)
MPAGARTVRWIAALSLAVNAAVAAVYIGRQVVAPAHGRPQRELSRAALFRELATGAAAQRDVVMLGDSLTERGEWWELLERPVANRGIAGDTVADMRSRLDDIVALEPRVLFVLAGINDLAAGTPPDVLAMHHAGLVVELRRRLPRARIVVEALLPVRDALAARDNITTAAVRRTNQLLERATAGAGADWLDAGAALADATGELDPRHAIDGVHLSAAGYRAWAGALRPYLEPDSAELDARAPELCRVRLDTTKGPIVLEMRRAWAPHGADRFYGLVRAGYYDDVAVFRIRAGVWAQFGIHGDPAVAQRWRTRTIPDDPRVLSNERGTVAFAFKDPDGRTTQVFINLRDNSEKHDAEPFVPFARVVEGMQAADALYAEYGERAGGGIRAGKQDPVFEGGNAYLRRNFPDLDYIKRATIVE